jgi:hypothetical protein
MGVEVGRMSRMREWEATAEGRGVWHDVWGVGC